MGDGTDPVSAALGEPRRRLAAEHSLHEGADRAADPLGEHPMEDVPA